MHKDLDLIVFGATGLTGSLIAKHVYEWAAQTPNAFRADFSWAVAGRSKDKLAGLVKEWSEQFPNTRLKHPEIIIASVEQREQMDAMTRRGRVLINAVGPFWFLGEYVVRSCIDQGCHYVDVTGEPVFVERMQRTYHAQAVHRGVSIVHCCGFDCVPADMGVLWIKQLYASRGWEPTAVEMFVRILVGPAGLRANVTTYASAVHGFSTANALRAYRKESTLQPPPRRPADMVYHSSVAYDKALKLYHVPFVFADPAIVRLSQQQVLTFTDTPTAVAAQPPVYFAAYLVLPSLWIVLFYSLFGFVFQCLARHALGRRLLLRFPEFFSAGVFSSEHPTQEQLDQTRFETLMRARGREPGQDLQVGVRGPEPGYVATPRIVLQCALQFLEHDIPHGVWTPSMAFALTPLLDTLVQEGIEFDLVQ